MAKPPLLIPFERDPPHHQTKEMGWRQRPGEGPYLWRENFVFDDGLALVELWKSGHSCTYLLESVNDGRRYWLFSSEVISALAHGRLEHREVDGARQPVIVAHWTFCKKGDSYSVKAVPAG